MPLLLNIDTATPHASVCLSNDENVIAQRESNDQKEHASFLHTAIQSMLTDTGVALQEVNAVAVTSGPGSYTGLRVGLSSAKGFCYALNIPLICINTLEVMAMAAILQTGLRSHVPEPTYFCPMIDARRMEVFTGLYDHGLSAVMPPCSMILDRAEAFEAFLDSQPVLFFGDGSTKFMPLTSHKNSYFIDIKHSSAHLVPLAIQAFRSNWFANIAYAEPAYFKEFYTIGKMRKI